MIKETSNLKGKKNPKLQYYLKSMKDSQLSLASPNTWYALSHSISRLHATTSSCCAALGSSLIDEVEPGS